MWNTTVATVVYSADMRRTFKLLPIGMLIRDTGSRIISFIWKKTVVSDLTMLLYDDALSTAPLVLSCTQDGNRKLEKLV